MIPSEIEIKIFANRAILSTPGSKGLTQKYMVITRINKFKLD